MSNNTDVVLEYGDDGKRIWPAELAPPVDFICSFCTAREVAGNTMAVVGEVEAVAWLSLGANPVVIARTSHQHRGAQALALGNYPPGAILALERLLPKSEPRLVNLNKNIVSTIGSRFEVILHDRQFTRECGRCHKRVQMSRRNLIRQAAEATARRERTVLL